MVTVHQFAFSWHVGGAVVEERVSVGGSKGVVVAYGREGGADVEMFKTCAVEDVFP